MSTNYGIDGHQAVNWHYKVRLMSNYQNKLFHNIFSKGVIPESGNLVVTDIDGNVSTTGMQIKIPSGFSFFITPNNRYKTGTIQDDFNALSTLEQSILERQVLKCDIVKDFNVVPKTVSGTTDSINNVIVAPDHGFAVGDIIFIANGDAVGLTYGERYRIMPGATPLQFQISIYNPNPAADVALTFSSDVELTLYRAFGGWLVAEYNYLEFSDLPVEFSVVTSKPTDNKVVLAEVNGDPVTGYIQSVSISQQDIAQLNPNVFYEMNVDRVNGYHVGSESGYIPLSNSGMCSGLNVEMVNGYSGYEAAEKWQQNSGLNAEYIADEFGRWFQPGNASRRISLSNTILNTDLNAEMVGSSGYTAFESAKHQHSLDNITDGAVYRKPANVNINNQLTHDSFKNGAISKEKINNEGLFARNDDLGGVPMIVTGQETLTANYSHISFDPEHQFNASFTAPPDVMLQIVDTAGVFGVWSYVKLQAVDVTPTKFTVAYTGWSGVATGQYSGYTLSGLTIQYVAWGYGKST
jgi:hypothetical protein